MVLPIRTLLAEKSVTLNFLHYVHILPRIDMPSMTKAPLPFAPHRCLATSREDGELIDFGDVNVNEPVFRLYLQRGVIEEAARECCGMISAEEVAEIRRQMAELGQKLDEALKDVGLLGDLETRFGNELEGSATAERFSEVGSHPNLEIEPATPAGEEGV